MLTQTYTCGPGFLVVGESVDFLPSRSSNQKNFEPPLLCGGSSLNFG